MAKYLDLNALGDHHNQITDIINNLSDRISALESSAGQHHRPLLVENIYIS